MSFDIPRLTTLSTASGCGCKIAPKTLDAILQHEMHLPLNDNLIVGNDTRDDAAILKVTDTHALIATTDFFTPIVDDPYEWGYIAAANALSDVYAMGGDPILALAILGWPADLDTQIAALVLKGGRDACASVGIPVAGGHSIHSKEPFYGLTVNGWIPVESVKKNNNAKPGDLIFMTKPLGTGIITAAAKRNQVQVQHVQEAIQWMKKINIEGLALAKLPYVSAMTDITGFGLLGHTHEMCGKLLTATIQQDAIPKIDAALTYAARFIFPDNTWRNWQAYAPESKLQDEAIMPWICDPQTNGGLLFTIAPAYESEFLDFWSTLHSDALLVKIGHMEARTSEVCVQVIQD